MSLKKKLFSLILVCTISLPQITFGQDQQVTDSELELFVKVYSQVQQENEAFQGKMLSFLDENGMSPEEFSAMYEAKQSGVKDGFKEEQWKKFDEITAKLEVMQVEFQASMAQVMNKEGMSEEDYQRVFMQIQSDEALQVKFSEVMQKVIR